MATGDNPIIAYVHCDLWWELKYGPDCPSEHDDMKNHNGRKRKIWVDWTSEEWTQYYSQGDFLKAIAAKGA